MPAAVSSGRQPMLEETAVFAKVDYEVKVLVNPDVALEVGDPTRPNQTLRDTFGIHGSENGIMQFLDGNNRELFQAGLIARIRALEGDEKLQLTYKKRYDIDGDDEDAVNRALDQATGDGFGDQYEAQIEWGLDEKQLTISRKKKGPKVGGSLDLPGKKKSREIIVSELPSRMDDQIDGGAKAILQDAHLYGPVRGSAGSAPGKATRCTLRSGRSGVRPLGLRSRSSRSP
jgi:hypothetical protein